jgi:hypothetical protein
VVVVGGAARQQASSASACGMRHRPLRRGATAQHPNRVAPGPAAARRRLCTGGGDFCSTAAHCPFRDQETRPNTQAGRCLLLSSRGKLSNDPPSISPQHPLVRRNNGWIWSERNVVWYGLLLSCDTCSWLTLSLVGAICLGVVFFQPLYPFLAGTISDGSVRNKFYEVGKAGTKWERQYKSSVEWTDDI